MPDRIVIPHHLRVLAACWKTTLERLDSVVAPPLAVPVGLVGASEAAAFVGPASDELQAVRLWMARLTEWLEGPLAAALDDSTIFDADMRKVASRLDAFADDLIERRTMLRGLAGHPAFAKLAPRLDAVYASLLEQLRDFIAAVVVALGPDAPSRSNGKRCGDTIELSFVFRPDISALMGEATRWMKQSREAIETGTEGSAVDSSHEAIETGAKRSTVESNRAVAVVTVLVVLALLGVSLHYLGFGGAVLLVAFIAVLVFVIRHPLIALIAILFGLN